MPFIDYRNSCYVLWFTVAFSGVLARDRECSRVQLDENAFELYGEYRVRRGDERLQLFEILRDEYFTARRNIRVTRDLLYDIKQGIGCTHSASNYIFEKVD
jgi:hypothetical protein